MYIYNILRVRITKEMHGILAWYYQQHAGELQPWRETLRPGLKRIILVVNVHGLLEG